MTIVAHRHHGYVSFARAGGGADQEVLVGVVPGLEHERLNAVEAFIPFESHLPHGAERGDGHGLLLSHCGRARRCGNGHPCEQRCIVQPTLHVTSKHLA